MILVHFQSKPFNIRVIQVYALTSNAEEAKVDWFYEDLQDLLEVTPKKDDLFITGDCNAGNQEITRITGKFGLRVQNEAEQRLTVLSREHTSHSKHPFPTTQETILHIDITRWSILKSDCVLCSQRWRSSIELAKIRPGADCGSDYELYITKFRFKLK